MLPTLTDYLTGPIHPDEQDEEPTRPPHIRSAIKTVAVVPAMKCERARYKRALREAFESAGVQAPLGGIEYGPDIAISMNLSYAAGNNHELASFVDDLRRGLRQTAAAVGH